MIRESGNVELFELCETIPKVQCSHCLLSRNQGIFYCTCGQFLFDSESRRKFNKLRLGCTLYPELRDQEGAQSWCSTWQNRRTKKVPYGFECVEEMLQESRLSKVNILQVITIDFLEIQFIVNHNSQSDGQNKSAQRCDALAQEDHAYRLSLSRGI